jgi:hypothetical protein
VTRSLNLVGLGNFPALTILHNVGAEKGRGATMLAEVLVLRTSCDSRSHALSGNASNEDEKDFVLLSGVHVERECIDV